MPSSYDRVRFLLRLHDGDDRCKCLADLVADLTCHDIGVDEVEHRLQECLDHHPAGSRTR